MAALMKQGEYAEQFCNLREYAALQHPQAQYIQAALGLKGGCDAKQ
ncbi:antirestriction protein [Xenorhabdus szentirmaii]